ncbi:MAG: TetR family transcriptional regulator [Nocardioides sp.]|uniref:TetR/AcrR family transcriptional regulator n=1 Tax=Nocardioides sp. TaxID=35761 RepID=UPI0039E5997F
MPPSPRPPDAARPPLRKDAERSRQRILAVAATLMAEHGVDVGYDAIARAAGVGAGTVYRRFPERVDLVSALFRDRAELAVDALAEALRIEDPWQALSWLCERMALQWIDDRGLQQALFRSEYADLMVEDRDRIAHLADQVLGRAQAVGAARADLATTDLALLIHFASRVGSERPDVARRYVALVLDSVRARPDAEPLPGRAPTLRDFETIAASM